MWLAWTLACHTYSTLSQISTNTINLSPIFVFNTLISCSVKDTCMFAKLSKMPRQVIE